MIQGLGRLKVASIEIESRNLRLCGQSDQGVHQRGLANSAGAEEVKDIERKFVSGQGCVKESYFWIASHELVLPRNIQSLR